jgi:hypothetical protein
VIPFSTNAGWVGKSLKEIKQLCPNSTVENEMNIEFGTDYHDNHPITSEKEITEWISTL